MLDAIVRAVSPWAEITRVYAMFDDHRPLTPAIDAQPRTVSRMGRIPGAVALRRWLLPGYPGAVAELSRRLADDHARKPVDLLISTSSAAIKGLAPPAGVPHLCYCHAPARYLWSREEEYARGSLARRVGLRRFGPRLRAWDRASAANVTRFFANSRHTAGEVRRCFGREAEVLHPPVRTEFFTPLPADAPRGEHMLVVAALEPYKRVDLAIAAAGVLNRPLRVVGDGTQRASLQRQARRLGAPVQFLGRVSDERLREEYRTARALLFPQVEDFGIVAVEALACGLPVVARAQGGALDIITDGLTGAFFLGESPHALAGAVTRCPRNADHACRTAGCTYSDARFIAEFARHAQSTLTTF